MTLGAALRASSTSATTTPRAWIRWLPVQDRYRRSRAQRRLLRAGNQSVGKSTCLLADVLDHAEGVHPFRECSRPGEYWIICASWPLSLVAQTKLWNLCDQTRLAPGTKFTKKRGFRGVHPGVEVRHESGAYSLILFKTTNQDTLDLSSATLLGAAFDEVPKNPEVYSEVCKRVQATDGWVSIGMTPIGAPVGWVVEEVAAGRLEDIHTRLTPEAMIPIGARHPLRLLTGTPCDAAWIRSVEERTPEHEREVRVHGGWEIRSSGRYFSNFISEGAGSHVHTRLPVGRTTVCLGIDHGTLPGSQVALLVLVTPPVGADDQPRVYVLDMYADDTGNATPRDDAIGILAMLERHGMTWASVDHAFGDRVHMPGTGGQKSNRDLQAQIAKRLKIQPADLRPQMRTVKRGQGRGSGSLAVGSRWLYHVISGGRFGVHPACRRSGPQGTASRACLVRSLDNYDIAVDDEHKHAIDALRYALDAFIFGGWRRGPTQRVRIG